jgi:cytoskeleton protein RodZ
MTDDSDQLTAPVPVPVAPESESESKPTAGALMRRAREASGLHIAALAVSLKVPVKRLEALEADRFDLLPDAVFARALAGSVCRTLKLDPEPIFQQLPIQSTPLRGLQTESQRVRYGGTIPSSRPPLFGTISRPAMMGGLLFVVGALVLALLPPLDSLWTQTEAVESDPVNTQALPVMSVEPSSQRPSAVPPIPVLGSANVNASAAVSGLVVPAAELVETATPPASGIVVFKPTAESWVEVTDAKGTVLLRRRLLAGEVAGASGALPLSVIVGRADVTQVQVRSQSFDLAPVSRDNVARFEVK